jgi:hypothetical protein
MMTYINTYSTERDNGDVYLCATTTGLTQASVKFFRGEGTGLIFTDITLTGSLAEIQALVSRLQAEVLELGARIRNKQREEVESNDTE